MFHHTQFLRRETGNADEGWSCFGSSLPPPTPTVSKAVWRVHYCNIRLPANLSEAHLPACCLGVEPPLPTVLQNARQARWPLCSNHPHFSRDSPCFPVSTYPPLKENPILSNIFAFNTFASWVIIGGVCCRVDLSVSPLLSHPSQQTQSSLSGLNMPFFPPNSINQFKKFQSCNGSKLCTN